MARVLTIAGTALTSVTQLESINVGGQANHGSSTIGEVIVYDETNALFGTAEHFVRKQWSLTEDASGTAVYLGRGRIAAFETHRGDDDSIMGARVQYTFALEDQNLELRGFDVHNWVRPAETDVARVLALGTAYLNGSPRASTNLNTTTYVPNTNTVNLPAKTYYATDVIDVLEECASAADKTFFVTVDHELFYDQQASSAYAASIEISDGVSGAAAPDGMTYFAPIWDVGPALTWEGQDYASRVRLGYNQDSYISVTNATSEALHDYWYAHIFDNEITTAAEGSAIASSEAAYRIIGQRSYQFSIHIPAAQVYKVKVGHSIWIQAQAPVDATGRVRRRVAELKWEPDGPSWYFARLTLDQPIRARKRRNMTGSPSTGPHPAPEPVPDTAGSAIYTFTYTTHANDVETNTYSGGLLRQTGSWLSYTAWGGNDAAHFQSDFLPISANTEYNFYAEISWKYNPSVRNVDIKWRNGVTVVRTDRWITGSGHSTYTEYVESATFTSPATADSVYVYWTGFAGIKVDEWSISTSGTSTDDDPYALDEPGTSPYYARSDDPRFDAADQHVTTHLSRTMVNASGTALADGDIVVLDTTGENSVTRTTTASYTAGRVGIVLSGGSATADVLVALEGVGHYSPNINGGSAIAGYYLYTSTTAGAASFSATRTTGAFGRIVESDTGTPGLIDLWGVPDGSAGASLTVKETDGSPSVSSVDLIAFTGATVTDDTGGDVTVTISTTTIGAATSSHTHTAGDSSRGTATANLTVTGSSQDISGASLSLAAGTYIVTGIFDVTDNTSDRTFQGILDVNGTDEADFALLTPAGITGDRVTITQTWRITIASTQTVKLQAMYSGGSTGDFTVNSTNTAIVAWTSGGTNTSANITGAYDIEGNGSPSYTDAGMSDEFASGSLDGQWTAVGMTTGTIDDTATNIADSIYDLGTETGTLFVQVDQGDACGLRQDAIPAAGEQIIVAMWIPFPHDAATDGTPNAFRCGIGVNDSDTLYNSGNYRAMMWDGTDDARVVMYEGATVYSSHKPAAPAGSRVYWRIKRVSTTLYFYWSKDGIGWNAMTSVAVGTYNNFWVWWDASVAAGNDGAPIGQVLWVRHVANVNYRPW